MTLFQRFMRVLTHPQHAGEPLPSRKPKKPKPARSSAAGGAGSPMRVAQAGQKAEPSSATAVAEPPASARDAEPKIPTSPSTPVEVFAPDRMEPSEVNGDAALGSGSLLDDLEDSSLGLIHSDPDSGPEASSGVTDKASSAIEPVPQGEDSKIGEVFELIEKLRDHVDAQNGRFEQAMGVIDQIRTSAAALPEIRERVDSMLAALDELKAKQFQGHEKVERALSAQSARLDTIAQAIERATQREERLAESLVEINQTILSVSTTNDRLANAIEAMRRHEAERDARIGRALTGAQRWLIVLTLVMAIGMIATIITAVMAGG